MSTLNPYQQPGWTGTKSASTTNHRTIIRPRIERPSMSSAGTRLTRQQIANLMANRGGK